MALEVLLDSAKVPGTTLTYERLAQVLFERYGEPEMHNKQHYGKALGAAAEAIMGEAKDGGITVPPITVIVVSKAYGYASRGADQFVDRLKKGNYEENDPRRQEILKNEQKKVWNFGEEQWTAIQVLLGHRPVKRKVGKKVDTTLPPAARGGKGEGDQHKALKAWVLANLSRFLEFGLFQEGANEANLQSGDCVDAMLWNGVMRLAVEVKPAKSEEPEMIRGIFQCVKYRHTMNAEYLVDNSRLPGNSILVSTRPLSRKEQRIANILDVRYIQVPKSAEVLLCAQRVASGRMRCSREGRSRDSSARILRASAQAASC
jgi:hypothetical protein